MKITFYLLVWVFSTAGTDGSTTDRVFTFEARFPTVEECGFHRSMVETIMKERLAEFNGKLTSEGPVLKDSTLVCVPVDTGAK